MQELVIATNRESILSFANGVEVPAVLQHAGQDVLKSFMTFFTDQIRNRNTRDAYIKNSVAFYPKSFRNALSATSSSSVERFGDPASLV